MLIAALRDMQWRKRRFVIAILSTAIIFAMTLVLTGLANGFQVEAEKTVDSLGVDVFVVKAGASGPFVGATPFAPVDLRRIAASPGVVAAAPLAYAGGTVTLGHTTRNADLFGAPERGPGMPAVSEGTPPSTPDEVAVSSTLGRHVGDDVQIASRRLRIVGIVENSTALANLPNIFSPRPARSRWCTADNRLSPRSAFAAQSGRYPPDIAASTEPGRSPICSGR
jgi:putative ABC transport system permease protein